MTFLYSILALFSITFKRLWSQKGLTAVLILGITSAVALIMTVPLYSDAIYFQILQERIDDNSAQRRPAFAYLYDYIGSWYDPVQLEDTQAVDEYLQGSGLRSLGLQPDHFVRYFATKYYKLFPAGSEDYSDRDLSLGAFKFGSATGLEDHIEILAGRFPQHNPDPTAPFEILITESAANELGFQPGDQFTAYNFRSPDDPHAQLPVNIAGVWRPIDERSDFWFISPSSLNDVLFVAGDTFTEGLAPLMPNEINRAVWYIVMDGSRVNTSDVDRLLAGAQLVNRRVDTLLPNTTDLVSPIDALADYQKSAQRLQLLLTVFNIPVIALVLLFIVLIVGLAVDQRRNEIAVMRSRGATPWQVVGLAALEGLILGVISFALGAVLALLLAQLIGKTRSFLDFSAPNTLRITFTQPALRASLLAVGIAIIAQVLPTLSASRDTIITYKQDQARALKKPFWQRAWLDLLLLGMTVYGFYMLDQQGSLFAVGEAAQDDLFQNPLLFLLPTLAVFSLALLFLRIFPLLNALFSGLLGKSDSVGLLLASRELARTPRAYAMPLILLILTVSLAVFTASLAFTLDLQLIDEARYQIGADLNLKGAGRSFGIAGLNPQTKNSAVPNRNITYLPMAEYEEFPGVSGATRVGRYPTFAQVGGDKTQGTFLGIDQGTFSQIAFWRYDFAAEHINGLLNQLSRTPDGVLVSRPFMRENGLQPGDLIRLSVKPGGGEVILDVPILAAFDYFPTWYEAEDGPLFVGSLDTLFTLTGGEQPYEVWLNTGTAVDEEAFTEALHERRLAGWRWTEPFPLIETEQARPERQGLFGQLSVGFVAAALLTVIGFFMYALFSFKRRFVSLGVLRAIGLSTGQMGVMVAWETAVLILTGLTLGSFLGVWISKLFIPFLQIGRSQSDLIPPYLVEIAWSSIYQIYGLFLLLFAVSLIVLTVMLRRMKIFEAVKLGETV